MLTTHSTQDYNQAVAVGQTNKFWTNLKMPGGCASRQPIDRETLKRLLDYDPDTGLFHWKVRRSAQRGVGSCAGNLSPEGYVDIRIFGKLEPAHQLAWLYQTGVRIRIDHIDGDRANNRFKNLRPATQRQNLQNMKPKGKYLKGAHLTNQGTWLAEIRHNGRKIYLGRFCTERGAHQAYATAAKKFFGKFARIK